VVIGAVTSSLTGTIEDNAIIGFGMTGAITWTNSKLKTILGCNVNVIPSSANCSTQVTVSSTLVNHAVTIDMNYGVNNKIIVGQQGATQQVISGSLIISGAPINCSGTIEVMSSARTSQSSITPISLTTLGTGMISYSGICGIVMHSSSYDTLTIDGTSARITIYGDGTNLKINAISSPTYVMLLGSGNSNITTSRIPSPLDTMTTLDIDARQSTGYHHYDWQFGVIHASRVSLYDNGFGQLSLQVLIPYALLQSVSTLKVLHLILCIRLNRVRAVLII
jgi:hypothetical protein